jgi:DHA1 family tetracycline resistance protein-like MFS transporter
MPFFVKRFGASDVVVGALFATFALCQFVAGPVWGNVSDRIGRKAVLVVSQIGATIGWAMLAFAPNIAIVFLARIIEGFSGGNLSVTQAYVADLVAPEKRAQAFAYIGASFSAGLVFGPLAGGYLVERYGFSVPFLLAAGLQFITLIVTLAVLPESRSRVPVEEIATLGDIRRALSAPRVSPVLWQKFVYSLGLYGWFAVFALVLQRQLGFDQSSTSYFFCVFGVTSVIMQLAVVGGITGRVGDRRASLLGFASLVAAFALVPFMHGLWIAMLLVAFFSFGLSMANATIPAMLTALAPENMRGTVLGAASSLESVAGIVMPIATTYTLQAAGVNLTAAIPLAFVAAALVMGIIQACEITFTKQADELSASEK